MRVVVEAASARPRRMASMEREPRTLSLHELNYARVRYWRQIRKPLICFSFLQEAALYVLSTHSSQDAARIFTQGLKPVLVARSSNSTDSGSGSGSDDDGDVFDPEPFVDDTRHRQLRGRTTKKRDFATAPF